jgi:hypothetical protein
LKKGFKSGQTCGILWVQRILAIIHGKGMSTKSAQKTPISPNPYSYHRYNTKFIRLNFTTAKIEIYFENS